MDKEIEKYHVAVMLTQTVDGLNIRPDGNYIDVTFGGGGHSREILSRLGKGGHLYSFDQDLDATQNCPEDDRFTFVHSNFKYLKNWVRYYDITPLDGILADLGVSSHHFDDESRGFSFRFNGPLDMRMNKEGNLDAAKVINTYSEEDLRRIFCYYGELKNARRLANLIVKSREQETINTIEQLKALVVPLLPKNREKKELAKVFQALRIEVNHEMEALQTLLEDAIDVLAPGGRLSVLTYHSLEDRMVKNFIRSGKMDGKVEQDFYGNKLSPLKAINNKVIVASDEEQEVNPRSRSAKLRIAEKL